MANENTPRRPLTVDELSRLLDETFPELHAQGRRMRIVSVGEKSVRVQLAIDRTSLRPGGSVSGPTLFALADVAIYAALLAHLGPDAIQAVTANLNITFLSRPELADLVADARLIRIGRRLAYAEVELRSHGQDGLVAHATSSYALSPQVRLRSNDEVK
ncbi:MAG: PaaI family thioesterase [Hyphomicrobiaceae bacterium]